MATGPAAVVYKHFERVTDPRVNRGKNYPLLELLFVALTGTLCGAEGWADVERFANSKLDWFRRFIRLEHGVPSHDTLGRVFAALDTAEFLAAMHDWVDAFAGSLRGQGVAIDGKTLRGSFDAAAGKSPLHLITAFACGMRLCLRQMSVDDKSNEIPAVPELLRLMELSGATVTLDAMHCQVETARAILDADADYILVAKGNQETLYYELLDLFIAYGEVNYEVPGMTKHTTVEKSHGRKERREYHCIAAPRDSKALRRWPGIRSIIMIYRRREEGDKIHEDASRIRKGAGPEISAALRRMALNILQRDTHPAVGVERVECVQQETLPASAAICDSGCVALAGLGGLIGGPIPGAALRSAPGCRVVAFQAGEMCGR